MAWVKTKSYQESTGKLRTLYDRVKGPNNNVDNIMMMHSLRPHTMEGHMVLYKNVLHHSANKIPKWFLEVVGVWVSKLNECRYCVEHHFEGLRRLMNDEAKAISIRECLDNRNLQDIPLDGKEISALKYAQSLTENPGNVKKDEFDYLLKEGFSHGEILEINQVVSYFNYANRTVLGLGCSTDGDILGLSPGNSSDPNDWSHN